MSVNKKAVVRLAAVAAAAVVISECEDDDEKRKHRYWVRPWIKENGNMEQNTMLKIYKELLEVRQMNEIASIYQ